ncbi:hypothetical protein NADFUDRAFT_83258 [Nadsonia fulvescens var. elongata DSM 6958]|uniref:Mannosyl-oligosaccharide glucosidase n=1 Tax=Nadsonia fulvescens var. elongata DSM 6958 TaxID=857566 RepID=A0A1E3PIH0_9ASCO|nr:hypothetical protein NADFUDRAFT_83258 [Nadsonia fulvescens var. elongata DSM 6958]
MVVYNNFEYLSMEEKRLAEDKQKTKYWKRWGPYLSERQWATVREDYSFNGDAWSDFPHEHARSRVYRWGEDGIAGVSDNHQLMCFSFAFWNEKDDFLKERLFGLTSHEGNHGEDVKEYYFYQDNTPTHSYMKYNYKYPQKKYPYESLAAEGYKRTRDEPEYELIESGIYDENRYFDITIEMAKDEEDEEALHFRVTAWNRGPEAAPLHIIPQVWFRNTWGWGLEQEEKNPIPQLSRVSDQTIESDHHKFGKRDIVFAPSPGILEDSEDVVPNFLFTNNETNKAKLYNCSKNDSPYVKDAFHEYIVDENLEAVNPENTGTKSCAWYSFDEEDGILPGDYVTVRFVYRKKTGETQVDAPLDEELFDRVFDKRQDEADDFYYHISPLPISEDLRNIQRQSFAGLLWSKQFYHFIHKQWADGDPASPPPPAERKSVRNQTWKHLHIDDILSLPDKWEYPFFAAWDTAFHCIPLAMIDPEFAKKQLDLLTREWYMHPNGQLPAYEWNFGDVNPPVHAWAAYRTFKLERKIFGREDIDFLERVFQKLLINFTWWVNRKDFDGNNVFEGGFLGLDNIGLFNRSEPLPTGGRLEQADSTGWMAFYCLQMLNISLELAKTRNVYEDIASKFFEHFLLISDAMTYKAVETKNTEDGTIEVTKEVSLWNEKDQFYYDAISWGGPWSQQLPVKSLVGLIPLYACLTLEPEILNKNPSFTKRLSWFVENRPKITQRNIDSMSKRGEGERLLLSLVNKERLVAILEKMLDEDEFLSEYGIRSLSKYHEKNPFSMTVNGEEFTVDYVPGDSNSGLFGGNSNWRGPIWFPTTFLLIESLQRFYMYYGDTLKVECPKGSGDYMNLAKVAENIQHRLINIFTRNDEGRRATNGGNDTFDFDEHWKDNIFFYEFFHADNGHGLGASHQCGWTALVGKLIHDVGVSCKVDLPTTPKATAAHYFDEVLSADISRSGSIKHGANDPRPRLKRRMSTKSTLLTNAMSGLNVKEKNEPLYDSNGDRNTASFNIHSSSDSDYSGDEEDAISRSIRESSRFSNFEASSEPNAHLAEHIRIALARYQNNLNNGDELEARI